LGYLRLELASSAYCRSTYDMVLRRGRDVTNEHG
jgi:hypothetical protein